MSARVLFCCWPFEGHVFPQLSMALALRERGNEVAFYTGGRAPRDDRARGSAGLSFAQIEPAWLAVQQREREVGGRRQSLRVQHQAFREWLVETIPSQVEDLRAIINEWQADVLVTDASMWGPSLVLNEALPIPVALASPLITAVIPGPDAPPPGSGLAPAHNARGRARASAIAHATQLLGRGLRRRLDELRAQFGLSGDGLRRQRAVRAAAALHGAERRRARLQPQRSAGERALRRRLHVASAGAGGDERMARSAAENPAVGACHRREPLITRTRLFYGQLSTDWLVHRSRRSSRTVAIAGPMSWVLQARQRTCTWRRGSATTRCCLAVRHW